MHSKPALVIIYKHDEHNEEIIGVVNNEQEANIVINLTLFGEKRYKRENFHLIETEYFVEV
jgi:hypothetical protein